LLQDFLRYATQAEVLIFEITVAFLSGIKFTETLDGF
jgi:hypothetical protein